MITTATIEYFYSDDENDESSDSIMGSLAEVLDTWGRISAASSGFFGIMSPEKVPVQVAWDEETEAVLDIPIVERQGSMSKSIERSQFAEIIEQVACGLDPFEIEGLSFEPWQDE